jgi:hypothetical protein
VSGGLLTELPVSPAWAWLVRGLSCLAVLVLVSWWAAAPPDFPTDLRVLLSCLALVCCGLPWVGCFAPACRLRFDPTGCALATDAAEWQAGRMSVALDFGPCMLLRFDPAGSTLGRRRAWLAVDRRSTGAGWHALRGAVYSPPPIPVPDLPAERRLPPRSPEPHE